MSTQKDKKIAKKGSVYIIKDPKKYDKDKKPKATKNLISSVFYDRMQNKTIYTFLLDNKIVKKNINSIHIIIEDNEYDIDKSDIPESSYETMLLTISIDKDNNIKVI